MVEKKGDKKERYERLKLEDSILKATNKRNVSILKINQLIRNLELKWSTKTEITSKQI
jgi:transcriptional regulator NrdR family protein